MTTLVSNTPYVTDLAIKYPVATATLINNYLTMLLASPSSYTADINAIFDDATTTTVLNTVVDNLSSSELQTLFTTIFGNNTVVSDTIVNGLYNALTATDRIYGLTDAQINTLYTNILNDAYITDARLASLKNTFSISDNAKLQIIAKYNGITYTNEKTTYDAVIDDLTVAEVNTLWSTIKASGTMTADVYNTLGTFYLQADSSNKDYDVNSSYGYAHQGSGDTVYTGPYRLISGSYAAVTGVYETGTPSGTTARKFTYVSATNTAGYFRFRNSGFQFQGTGYTTARNYRQDLNQGYVYYYTNGNYYYYSIHGEYFQYSSSDAYAAFKNATLQPATIKYFLKNIFYSQNTAAAMLEVTKALYASTSMTASLEANLLSLSSTLSVADKRSLIITIYNAYSANLSVVIPSASTRADKILSIAAKASADGTYYNYVLHNGTYGIKNSISLPSKLAIVDSVLNNESGVLGKVVVAKKALSAATNDEYYLARALSANATFFKNEITSLLVAGLGNSNISYYNIGRLIDLMVAATPSLFNSNIIGTITLNDADKLAIVAEICYYDAYNEYTDPGYTGSNILVGLLTGKGYQLNIANPTHLANLEATLTAICELAGLNINNYTDFVGIYALASSEGIQQGQFMPDNVKLINLDEYLTGDGHGNLLNDASWRGGNAEYLNNFYVLDGNGQPTTVLNTNCVNYKIYYMMKQLKKSIATTVFKIELEGTDRTNPNIDYVISNNILEDYDNKNRIITFYVAANADEINATEFLANILTEYELSYNAIFKENSLRPIVMGTGLTPGDIVTSKVGGVSSYTFIVQAEDRTVETEYVVNIVITAPKTISAITNLKINNGANYAATPITAISIVDVSGSSYADVASVDGSLKLTYVTKNLPNGMDMKNNIKMYSYANLGQSASQNCIPNNIVTNYNYNSILNNGRVVVTTVGESAFNEDYTWDDGTLIVDLDINSQLPTGKYILELRLTQTIAYLLVFEKAASAACVVEEITFADQPFLPAGASSNASNPTDILFGTQLTESFFTNIDLVTDIPSYLSTFEISPLATYVIESVTVDATDPTKKVYNVNYRITAENGVNTSTFKHIIEEEIVTPEAIKTVYVDGGIVDDNPKASSNFSMLNNKYTTVFGREKAPTYRFDYDLSKAYFGLSTDYLHVEYAGGDLSLSEQQQYFSVDITEGEGFSIEFNQIAPPREYLFDVYYEFGFTVGVPTYQFKSGTYITWHLDLTSLSITKDKNIRSYLDNATFITETVLTTIDTLLSVDRITAETYAVLRASTNREIVSLPSGIFYNEHEYSSDNIYNHRSLIYMVGLVNKTNLTAYKPIFALPEDAKIYRTANFSRTPYAYFEGGQWLIEYFYVSENKEIVLDSSLNGILPTGTVENFVHQGRTYSALTYFPYTSGTGGSMVTTYFYVNLDGSIILNSSGAKLTAAGTKHEFVYGGTTYSAYEYTSYTYLDGANQPKVAYFYVRTDGLKILNSSGNVVTVSGNRYRFTLSSVEYIFKNVYSLREYTYNTSQKLSFYVSDNGIWYKSLNKTDISVVGTKDDFIYNSIRYTYNNTDVAYRYTPYTYVDEENVVRNIVFLVSENGTDFKDITGQEINITSGNYTEFVITNAGVPITYTLSITDGLSGVDDTFERISYSYVEAGDTYQKEFYVSLAGTVFQNENHQNIIISSGTKASFIYNGVTYTLVSVLETANFTYENFSLEADYNPQVGATGVEFNYARYRVYSEKFADDQNSLYYTDYKIAIQDITNNVRFDINIRFDNGITLSDKDSFRLFLELINKAKDMNKGSWTTEADFILNNRMGMFAIYNYNGVTPSPYLDHGTFTTNTSGGYIISIELPGGYTFSYTIKDPIDVDGFGNVIPRTGEEADYFIILGDALLSRIVELDIVIKITTPPVIDWGQHLETDLLEPYLENSPNV